MKKNTMIAVIAIGAVVLAGIYFLAQGNNTENVNPENNNAENNERVMDNKLEGKTWVWNATTMNNDEVTSPKELNAFTITFNEDGKFNGTTDCNNYFGEYTLDGNKLTFGGMASTKMYCQDSQENDYTSALSEVDQFMFDANGNLVLNLKLDSGVMIFVEGAPVEANNDLDINIDPSVVNTDTSDVIDLDASTSSKRVSNLPYLLILNSSSSTN